MVWTPHRKLQATRGFLRTSEIDTSQEEAEPIGPLLKKVMTKKQKQNRSKDPLPEFLELCMIF